MIVEFIGVPGAGKTTTALALAQRFEGFSLPPKYPGKRYALLFLAQHPLFTLLWITALLREGLQTGTLSLARYKWAGFTYTCARFAYAVHHSKNGAHRFILDEGMAQRFLSLYERPRPVEVFESWLRFLPRADFTLSLEGEPFDPYKTSPRRQKLGDKYLKGHRAALLHNQKMLAQALRLGRGKCFSCSAGSGSVDSCMEVFADKIAI